MNLAKINVGRVKSMRVQTPWWMHCPLCPVNPGFQTFATHEAAWDAAERHLFKRHPNAVDAKSWWEEVARHQRISGTVIARG